MRDNRIEMGMIMSKEDLDTSAFYAISSQQTELMIALDHSMINMNLALRSTLNNQQVDSYRKKIELLNNRKLKGRSGEARKRIK